MSKDTININLDNNNKKIGLATNEDLPNAIVNLEVNGHDLKFSIGRELDDKYYPPAPPNSCNSNTITDAASYVALVKSNNACGHIDSYSQLNVETLNAESMIGIKVQGQARSELKITKKSIEHNNLDILKLIIGQNEFDLLNQDQGIFEISDTGLDLLLVEAIQHSFLIGDLDGSDIVNANDALMALKLSAGILNLDHINKTVTDNESKELNDGEGIYKRLEVTHNFLKDNFSYGVSTDTNNNFLITASVALAILQIAVQFVANNFNENTMPNNQ